jgi:hypothetical protein
MIMLIGVSIASLGHAQKFVPAGAKTVFEALDPTLKKWWVPHELHRQYKWNAWEYSNYARDLYRRYTDIELEGERWYDIYGNYITRGWEIYEWSQEQGVPFGSGVSKKREFASFFDNLLIGHDSKGEYHLAVSIGDEIRSSLTPFTFSKPSFNGIQVDFLSDKYGLTAVASRVNAPASGSTQGDVDLTGHMDFSNLFGFRGTVQVGDLFQVGATYVNLHLGTTEGDYSLDRSLKGDLTTDQNSAVVRSITLRISDDSPEMEADGEYRGAAFFSEEIWTRRMDPDGNVIKDWGPEAIRPSMRGGFPKEGYWTAEGSETIELTYEIPYPHQVDRVGFRLVLSNDYRVDMTSDRQLNAEKQEVFLPVTRAAGNVHDNSNQKIVSFEYGLPTGREVYGFTFQAEDLSGFNIAMEYDVSRKYRRYPNVGFTEHALSRDKGRAFYLTVRKSAFPYFGYGEIFSVDENYGTDMFLVGADKTIDYENKRRNVYEFVDDNDDQDRYPDWARINQIQDRNGIFPGLDANNDFRSDFNQNANRRPDYDEPFLRHHVDPPEFLFGLDMNHNAVVDRFEDDELPDYPYKTDHRGFNIYVGAEVVPGVTCRVGHLREWLWSDDRRSRDTYALFMLQKDDPKFGRFQVFNHLRFVKDDVPDDQLLWRDVPGKKEGIIEEFMDPLPARNTVINTAFLGFDYTRIPRLNLINKMKYETYTQRGDNLSRTSAGAEPDTLRDARFLGIISKLDYTVTLGRNLVIQPRAKIMYRRRTPFQKGRSVWWDQEINDFTGIPSLILKYPLMKYLWLEQGLEYVIFRDQLSSHKDYDGSIFGLQFSIKRDYMGYMVTVNIGGRLERKVFEERVDTSSLTFIQVFAGMGR